MNAKGLHKLFLSTTKSQQRLLNKKFMTKQRFYKNVTINEDKASTLAIATPAYLYTLLGFVEPKPNATFCINQQTGALGGNGKYFIQLDGKNVKTPLRNDLYAPTQKLASIVASEWSSQKQTILAHQMHMTSLCNTCIDNPRKRTKEDMIHDTLSFLNSDTLCARTPIEESEHIAKIQSEKWDPVLHWFSKRFDVEIVSSTDIFGFEQPEMTMLKMKQYLSKLSRWQLEGLEFSVDSVKSFTIPFAVIENYTTVKEAIYLARLEVNLQIEKWGSVEWYHDIEKENQLAHMSAGVLFYQLCSESFDDELI